jgi:hypothetical protein
VLILLLTVPAGAAETHSERDGVLRFGRVFLIISENIDYSRLGMSNAPYLLGIVQPQSARFSNYYSATHWSQANYDALVSGQYTHCEQEDGGIACQQNAGDLLHRLDGVGS